LDLPETDLPTLFEAFHRASNVGEIPGTGLGLVISKRRAELHGGSIQVKSTPGEGAPPSPCASRRGEATEMKHIAPARPGGYHSARLPGPPLPEDRK